MRLRGDMVTDPRADYRAALTFMTNRELIEAHARAVLDCKSIDSPEYEDLVNAGAELIRRMNHSELVGYMVLNRAHPTMHWDGEVHSLERAVSELADARRDPTEREENWYLAQVREVDPNTAVPLPADAALASRILAIADEWGSRGSRVPRGYAQRLYQALAIRRDDPTGRG